VGTDLLAFFQFSRVCHMCDITKPFVECAEQNHLLHVLHWGKGRMDSSGQLQKEDISRGGSRGGNGSVQHIQQMVLFSTFNKWFCSAHSTNGLVMSHI